MKPTASKTSRRALTQLANRLFLGRTFEDSYGAGIMTADYTRAAHTPGWTARQLLSLSAAKSFYN